MTQPALLDVTGTLARYVVSAPPGQLPEPVRRGGVRTFLNWVGCAVGSSGHPAVAAAVRSLSPFCGPAQAGVLGRAERVDVLHAALFNGISSHVFDFDDTHLRTVIHPAGPVASAILALAEHRPATGIEFLNALVLGVEVECRIGNAVGSTGRPMTDEELGAKFDKLVVPVLGRERAARLRQACWAIEQAADVSQIARLAAAG